MVGFGSALTMEPVASTDIAFPRDTSSKEVRRTRRKRRKKRKIRSLLKNKLNSTETHSCTANAPQSLLRPSRSGRRREKPRKFKMPLTVRRRRRQRAKARSLVASKGSLMEEPCLVSIHLCLTRRTTRQMNCFNNYKINRTHSTRSPKRNQNNRLKRLIINNRKRRKRRRTAAR
jgi:hypothetical protein